MSDSIGNIGGLNASLTTGVRASSAAPEAASSAAAARRSSDSIATGARRSTDRVDVSEVAHWLSEMDRLPAIRADKVAAARAAIAEGRLDSDDRLAVAVQRMIDDIG